MLTTSFLTISKHQNNKPREMRWRNSFDLGFDAFFFKTLLDSSLNVENKILQYSANFLKVNSAKQQPVMHQPVKVKNGHNP